MSPRARRERYFEFPLLERYLTCKQRAHSLVFIYILRNVLLLFLLVAACLYLAFLHLTGAFQHEFSCSVTTGEPQIPPLIPCKLLFSSIFQLLSIVLGGVYVVLVPVVAYNALQLCRWDKGLLAVYEMLPAFDILSRKMLGCPLNDLNLLLLFLRANVARLASFGRLSAVGTLKEAAATDQGDIDTVVDFMTLLAGLEAAKPKNQPCANGRIFFFGGGEDIFLLIFHPLPRPKCFWGRVWWLTDPFTAVVLKTQGVGCWF